MTNNPTPGLTTPITSLSTGDLEGAGFDVSNVSQLQLDKLARKMENAYADGQFWQDLEILADLMEIPRKA